MKNKVSTIFFAGFLILLSMLNILRPEKTFSNKENRYLQTLPEISGENIMSGKFADEFNDYSSDQFIGRDYWIGLKTISDLALLKKDNGRVYFGKEDYLFDLDDGIDQKQYRKNIENINIFLDTIKKENEDIDIYALLIPSKSSIMKDLLPLNAPLIDEEEIIADLNKSLKENINILNIIDLFNEKADQYIYYKTDHHWTSKGAFYAYTYFLKNKGQEALTEDEFTIERVSKNFLGTNYRKANLYLGEPDEIHIYTPRKEAESTIIINQQDEVKSFYDETYLDKIDKYSYFFGGDQSIIEIESSVKNGKKILLIKDSFANSFIPFLEKHYENILVIDPRYYKASIIDFIASEEIDEVLFLFNIQTFVQEKTFYMLSL